MIECPLSAIDMSRTRHFGRKVLLGIFFGYAVCAEDFANETLLPHVLRSWEIGCVRNHERFWEDAVSSSITTLASLFSDEMDSDV